MKTTAADELHEKFYDAYHHENYTEAIVLLQSIAQQESRPSFWINSRLSSCYYELRDYAKAVEYGKRAYKLQPKSPLVLWDYAGALIMAQQEKKGIRLLLRLQSMDDDLTLYGFADADCKWMQSLKRDANYLIGHAYYIIMKDDLAKQHFQQYVAQRKKGLRTIYSKKKALKYLKKFS